MNGGKRVVNFIIALVMIFGALLLMAAPAHGYKVIVFLLTIALLVKGLRLLVYYFSMARHAVGGIAIFYQGVLLFDAGLFALTLDSIPLVYTMLYLIICMLVSGTIDVMRSNEARVQESGRWKLQMVYGVGNIILAVIGVFFLHSFVVFTIIFAIDLLHSGICRMISAVRKSAIVYIGG